MKTAPNPKKTFISNINFYEKFFLAFFSAILILESYFQMIEKKKISYLPTGFQIL
jgi:hypothetical protein